MTSLVIIMALFGIAYSFNKVLVFWKLYQAVQHSSQQERGTEENSISRKAPLKVSFIGSTESGKSQLQAALADQFQKYATSNLNVRLLTHKEEEKLRGRLLKVLQDSDDYRAQSLDEYSSKSLIQARQLAFQDKQYYQKSSAVEHCYLLTTFSTLSTAQAPNIELKPQCLNLLNLPGEFLLDERGHQGHFKGALKDSKALVMVVDGLKLIRALEQQQDYPFAIHYTQALEYYYQHSTTRAVYLVISKIDLLVNKLTTDDKKRTEDYLLQRVFPLLQLKENTQALDIYWTSVDQQSESLWTTINSLGLDIIKQIKSTLLDQQAENQRLLTKYEAGQSQLAYVLLIAIVLLWSLIGALQMTVLPTVKGDVTWDWGSLKTSSTPYISAYKNAQSIVHPLKPYEARLRSSLKVLNSSYFKHLNDQSRRLIKSLPEQAELLRTSKALNSELNHYLNYQKQVASWLKKKDDESRRVSDILELIQDVKAWQILKDSPNNMGQIQAQFQALKPSKWGKRCEYSQGENDFVCLIQDSYLKMYKKALGKALLVVSQSQRSVSLPPPKHILIQQLSPLLQWQKYSQDLNPRDLLLQKYDGLMKQAWKAAWQTLLGRLSKSKLNEGIKRLRLIESFELNRRELETQYALKLPMPKWIMSHWIELLNREVDQQKQSLKAKEMIIWAENYLDHHRAARVRLSQAELSWQNTIVHALNRTHRDPSKLNQAIEQMKLDLATLQSLNGANDIKSSINTWQTRLKALEAWKTPQKLSIQIESIECDKNKFEESGYIVDEGVFYYPDSLNYYLRLQSFQNQAWLDVSQVSKGETIELTWSPWQRLKLSVYDEDGDKDVRDQASTQASTPTTQSKANLEEQDSDKKDLSQANSKEQDSDKKDLSQANSNEQDSDQKESKQDSPNKQESDKKDLKQAHSNEQDSDQKDSSKQVTQPEQDDDLACKAREWRDQRDPPNGTIQFEPKGLCSVKVQSDHPLPAWLYELKWLTNESSL
ncbi:MAG: hypothetical protein CMH49_06750 [Myxococcales bacterium]|nr:hypothetical protein [Myxococcales bacterium]